MLRGLLRVDGVPRGTLDLLGALGVVLLLFLDFGAFRAGLRNLVGAFFTLRVGLRGLILFLGVFRFGIFFTFGKRFCFGHFLVLLGTHFFFFEMRFLFGHFLVLLGTHFLAFFEMRFLFGHFLVLLGTHFFFFGHFLVLLGTHFFFFEMRFFFGHFFVFDGLHRFAFVMAFLREGRRTTGRFLVVGRFLIVDLEVHHGSDCSSLSSSALGAWSWSSLIPLLAEGAGEEDEEGDEEGGEDDDAEPPLVPPLPALLLVPLPALPVPLLILGTLPPPLLRRPPEEAPRLDPDLDPEPDLDFDPEPDVDLDPEPALPALGRGLQVRLGFLTILPRVGFFTDLREGRLTLVGVRGLLVGRFLVLGAFATGLAVQAVLPVALALVPLGQGRQRPMPRAG